MDIRHVASHEYINYGAWRQDLYVAAFVSCATFGVTPIRPRVQLVAEDKPRPVVHLDECAVRQSIERCTICHLATSLDTIRVDLVVDDVGAYRFTEAGGP